MVKIKDKGFTLVELLATIIILGLLTTIAYVSVTNILDRGNDSYYDSQENMLVLAGREYFADHRSELPKEIGGTSTVTLETLIEEKYIDPIKDKNENVCDELNSTVTAQKITDRDFQYYGILTCGNYETTSDKAKPTISFNPNKKISEDPITVTMKITDNEEVQSYRYVITKDGEEYQDSGYQTYNSDVTINLTELGLYRITGYAIDSSGNMSTRNSGKYSIYKGINCNTINFDSSVKPKTWTNKDIIINVSIPSETYRWELYTKVNDGEFQLSKSYIDDSVGNVILSSDGVNQVKLVTYDQYGNSCTTISDEYYIDKTAPSCVSSGGSDSWQSGPLTITGTCSDLGSGCTDNVTKTFSSDTNTTTASPGTVYDNVGNSTVCPADQTIKIDKTAPSCGSITGQSTTWTNKNRTISITCSDSGSGCTSSSFSNTFSTEGATDTISIKDNIGNTRSCSVNKYIDKTAPIYVSSSKYNHSNGYSYFGWNVRDNVSGVNGSSSLWEYCYTGHTSSSCGATCGKGNQYSHYPSRIFGSKYNYYFQDAEMVSVPFGTTRVVEAGVLTSCVRGYGIRTNFKICDYAGNCSYKENSVFSF